MPQPRDEHRPGLSNTSEWLYTLAAVLVLGMLYGLLACRDLYWSDSAELVLVARHWGIAHPSGYPLYTLLAGLWVRVLPLGEPFALSLLSVLFVALSGGVLFRILRYFQVAPPLALIAALGLLLMRPAGDIATVPEVYALHLFFQLLLCWFLLRWWSGERRLWPCLWLVLGLSFSNHLITVWFLAPLALLLIFRRAQLKALRPWALAAGMLALGLLPYLYLPLRAGAEPLMNQGDPDSIARIYAHMSGAMFRYRLFTLSGEDVAGEVAAWWRSLHAAWGWPILLFAPFGLWRLWQSRFDRKLLLAFGLWLAIGLAYTWNYFIPDKQGYVLIPHLLVGLLVAVGVFQVAAHLARRVAPERAQLVTTLLCAAVPLMLATPVDRHANHSMRDLTRDVWRTLEPGTVLVSESLPLVWASMWFADEGLLPRNAAVVSQYYLGFAWYRAMLRQLYPDLVLPETLTRLGERFKNAGKKHNGEALGKLRQKLAEEMSAELIKANRERRPMAVFIVDDEQEATSYQGFALQNRGLAYKVVTTPQGGAPQWQCDYPQAYAVGKQNLADERSRYVAGLYATACNRFGIHASAAGQPEQAAAAFRQALAFDPGYLQALKNLGVVLVRELKQSQEGRKILEEYVLRAGDEADPGIKAYLRTNGSTR